MTIIYLIVSIILGAITWVCSQLSWQYGYILMYIFMFLTSWYICLVFIFQEEYEREKRFYIFTVPHLIYYLIDIGIIIFFWKYNLKDWKTVTYARCKAMAVLNIVQGTILMAYYKLRSIYIHL